MLQKTNTPSYFWSNVIVSLEEWIRSDASKEKTSYIDLKRSTNGRMDGVI